MNIDNFDKKILEHLSNNARTAYSKIGNDIGLTAPAVAQRVQKMEAKGIIKGFTLLKDAYKMGISVKAIITIKIALGKVQAFKKQLEKLEEVTSWYRVTGEDCVMMHTQLKDNQHLLEFLDKIIKYGTTRTNIILEES